MLNKTATKNKKHTKNCNCGFKKALEGYRFPWDRSESKKDISPKELETWIYG
jgi:hypothetical protein